MSKQALTKFRDGLKEYRSLLSQSAGPLLDIEKNHTEIGTLQSLLTRQYASLEDVIQEYSRGPMYTDPMWGVSQDAYFTALSNDILQRKGPALDSVINDLDYVIAKYSSKNNTRPKHIGASIGLQNLHPKIIEKCNKKFTDGHYSDAVLTAYKVVLSEIKDVANISNLDGKKLVENAFSLNNPIIKLNPLKTQSDIDEQQGYMLLYSGAALGIRNPKAHDLVDQDDPKRALQLLAFASLLMDKLDEREDPK